MAFGWRLSPCGRTEGESDPSSLFGWPFLSTFWHWRPSRFWPVFRTKQSWTADILLNGFFLIPMLATTQLRPGVGTVVTVPTVLVYLASSIAARHSNDEPWASVILRTGVLAALSLGCVLMSAIQRSRVLTIAGLVSDRTLLVSELADVEAQARRDLAEELHDGALQYVLAARQDLADIRPKDGAESFDRVDYALRESTTLVAVQGYPAAPSGPRASRVATRHRGPGAHYSRPCRAHCQHGRPGVGRVVEDVR